MKVPLIDLQAQRLTIKEDLDDAIERVMHESVFIGGAMVLQFEAAFGDAIGVRNCIGVANGTDALLIALTSLGIGPGDEVITVAHSWISTGDAISRAGATPVFIDIASEDFNIDTELIAARITPSTRAIIVVHLYGHPTDMNPVVDLCKNHDLRLIEDCAQAHFAQYKGITVGLIGDIATFSFYPTKVLGAYGDAGAIVTNDDALATQCRVFAHQGALVKHRHVLLGINSRLDTMQAAVLSAKLRHVPRWIARRRSIAEVYDRLLKDIEQVTTPQEKPYAQSVYYLYVIRCERRDELMHFLKERGITTAIHYPTPIPLQPLYRELGYDEASVPVAAAYARQILSLPMYPELTGEMIAYVADMIKAFYQE